MFLISAICNLVKKGFGIFRPNPKPSQNQQTTFGYAALMKLLQLIVAGSLIILWAVGIGYLAHIADLGIIQHFLTSITPEFLTQPITINPVGVLIWFCNSLIGVFNFLTTLLVSGLKGLFPAIASGLTTIGNMIHVPVIGWYFPYFDLPLNKSIIDLIPFITTLDEFYSAININLMILLTGLYTAFMVWLSFVLVSWKLPTVISDKWNLWKTKTAIKLIEKAKSILDQIDIDRLPYGVRQRLIKSMTELRYSQMALANTTYLLP